MEVLFRCLYCDHKWIVKIYGSSVPQEDCGRCGDKNIIVKSLEKSKIDYYAGALPFPKEEGNGNSYKNDGGGYGGMDFGF